MKILRTVVWALMLGCYPYPSGVDAEWCESHTCQWTPLALSSDAEHAPVVQAAIDRLRGATGADIIMDPFGIPVMFVPVATSGDCGAITIGTDMSTGRLVSMDMYVSTEVPNCRDPVDIIIHEFIHSVDPNAEHAKDGVFAANANPNMRLRGESLDILCAGMGGCPLRRDE